MKLLVWCLSMSAALQAGCGTTHRLNSLSDLDGLRVGPGDQILLHSGQTYAGTIRLGPGRSGRAWRPVVIESDGAEPAVINGGPGSAIVIDGASHLAIRNVKVVGSGRKEGNQQGVGVLIDRASHVCIDRVEASGFQRAGVEIKASGDVRLTEIHAHDNGYAGISSTGGTSRRLHLARCRAINNPGDPILLNNHSGNGIVLMNVERAVIDRCEAAENGWDMPHKRNGPVGIWCAHADRVVIRRCVSHHNKSTAHDGGGFDFDGGVTNSVMHHNYSHHNQGYGYLLYEYGSGMKFGNNTIRDCVSEDDGEGGIGLGVRGKAPPGTTLGVCVVRHNVVRNSLGRPAVSIAEGDAGPHMTVRDNTFITTAPLPDDCRIILRHNKHTPPTAPVP